MKNTVKIINRLRDNKAITLIALIVTIVVLLILAGVSISFITGNEGTIEKAGQAKLSTEAQEEMKEIQEKIDRSAAKALRNGNFSGNTDAATIKQELKDLVTDTSGITGNAPWQVTGSKTGTNYLIKQSFEVIPMPENTGTRTEMNVQVGDFVNYDAGTWTQEDINKLGNLYSGETVPDNTKPYTFGGFKVGQSKDVGIIQGENNASIQDNEHAGWRVLKINEDGSINIIHAGCPEWYYQSQLYGSGSVSISSAKSSARSQYILAGIKLDNIDESAYENVNPRNWSMYENIEYVIIKSSHSETFQESKSITGWEGNTSNSLRRLGFNYFISLASVRVGDIRMVNSNGNQSSYGRNISAGIRPVVTLKAECLFQNVNDENTTTHDTQETAWNLVI